MQAKAPEIIRILSFFALGGLLMFLIQPILYQNQIFFISDQPPEIWISNEYIPGTTLVFLVSASAAIAWYFWSARAKIASAEQVQGWKLMWWLIGLFPVISIGVAIATYNTSPDGSTTLAFLYPIDVFLLYWIPTATSSPAPVKYLPPLSVFLRPLFEPGS